MARDEIKVVMVDDHELFREGLAALFRGVKDIVVVGQAHNADTAVVVVKETFPDVVLLDADLPGSSVRTTMSRISRAAPETRIVILAMHRDRVLGDDLRKAGAAAFLTKSEPFRHLVASLRHVMRMKSQPGRVTKAPPSLITSREHEVLRLISRAQSNGEIAVSLGISVGTVKRHTNSIYRKLDAVSRIDAMRRAASLGYLPFSLSPDLM